MWSQSKFKKKLHDFIKDASKKLEISGVSLVLNNDGTNVDSDKELVYEIF